MSEFADCSITQALISAATSVITFMAESMIVIEEESKKCSADELKTVINYQRVITKQDELLDQSGLQANKHVIEYSADIYKETPYGRQCYYVLCYSGIGISRSNRDRQCNADELSFDYTEYSAFFLQHQ